MPCSNLVECLRSAGANPYPLETTYAHGYKPENVLNYTNNVYYHSQGPPENTLTVDFTTYVTIRGYEIKADNGGNWLLNWKVEVKEGGRWATVDTHDNDVKPSECGVINFTTPLRTRYIRFTGTKTFEGNQYFAAYYVKFSGGLSSLFCENRNTCKKQPHFSTILLHLFISLVKN